mgnify:CR=1 FL=1
MFSSAIKASFVPLLCALAPAIGWAADTPTPDKGDIGWIMTCTVLVILMTIPGLALFYGGMVRSKNVLVTFCLVALLWTIYGYSIAFTTGNAFFGGFDRVFLAGLTVDSLAATFSKGVYIPEYVYFCFQLTFAAITPCLIVGAFAERVKFSALLLVIVIWFTFAYLPVWSGSGLARMLTPIARQQRQRTQLPAFYFSKARSISPAARSCTSMPA